MLIREVGIIFNGIPVVYTSYHRASKDSTDLICSSGVMTGLLTFAECLIQPIEYFESNNYTIVFKKAKMQDYWGKEQNLFAFLIIDKDERLEKYLNKTIHPILEKLLENFISEYQGTKITNTIKFAPFKKTIDRIFGTGTLTLEEKVISLLV